MVIVTYFFRGNSPSPDRLFFSNKQQGIFYMHFPPDRTVHTTAFEGPVVDHWLEGKIAQTTNAHIMQARSDDPNLNSKGSVQ